MNMKTDISYDYLESIRGNDEKLYEYINDKFIYPPYNRNGSYKTIEKCKALAKMFEIIGIKPSQDQFIFSASYYPFTMVQACAGSGKTTISQALLAADKLFNQRSAYKILSITFTDSAAKDMSRRHKLMLEKITKYFDGEVQVDDRLEACTFHVFAKRWLEEYNGMYPDLYMATNIKDSDRFPIMDYEDTISYMQNVVDGLSSEGRIVSKNTIYLASKLLSLYQWASESVDFGLRNAKSQQDYIDLKESLVSDEVIRESFVRYYKMKREKCVMDMSDLLTLFYKLIQKPEVIDRIRDVYDVILFDEYQDISRIMLKTLLAICKGDDKVKKTNKFIRLICIGDIDQWLYRFRGVSSESALNFKDIFGKDESIVLSISENRRSLAPIVEASANLISHNKERIIKPIVPVRGNSILEKDKGKLMQDCSYKAIEVRTECSKSQYISEIVAELKKKTPEELGKVEILYRNRASSILVAFELFDLGIPCIVDNGVKPYGDAYSKTLRDFLSLLATPKNYNLAIMVLPSVMPKMRGFNKNTIRNIVKKELREFESNPNQAQKAFWDYDFGDAGNSETIKNFLDDCYDINRAIVKKKPLNYYIGRVTDLLDPKALSYGRSDFPPESVLPEIIRRYHSDLIYSDWVTNLHNSINLYKEHSNDLVSVHLSTMHGVKGLERDVVYIIDLVDSIIPGPLNAELNYTIDDKIEIQADLEDARRLLYVGMTRAKNKLILYANRDEPSRLLFEIGDEYLPESMLEMRKELEDTKDRIEVTSDTYAEVDTDELLDKDNYFASLKVVRISVDNREYNGYKDGEFILSGDYEFKISIEEREREKEEKVLQYFGTLGLKEEEDTSDDTDLFAEEFGDE